MTEEKMVEDALTWLDEQEASNDYLHNLKVAASLAGRRFWFLPCS